jgi:hypothetical protein
VELGGLSSLAWDGVQKASLPIPVRFAVTGTTPAGQATSNATLERLTISRSGGPGLAGVWMISDDNFSATQFTRVLNLLVKLP